MLKDLPRAALEDHLVYFGTALLCHIESPAWVVRGYGTAKGFEIRFCSADVKPVLRLCRSMVAHPEDYLGEDQLPDWEVTVFGPDHKIGADISQFVVDPVAAMADALDRSRYRGGPSCT